MNDNTASVTGRPDPPSMLDGLPWRAILAAAWVVCLVSGALGIWQRLTMGHLPAGYGSYVPWGLWIALYFHGVGMAGGVFAIAALGFTMGWRGFTDPRGLRLAIVLSVAAIVPGLLGVLLDLGHMERAHRIMTSPSFGSMMAFNAWMYNFYLLVAGICWFISYRAGSGWLKPFLVLGALLAVMFPSQSGAFFGVVDAKVFWHSALLPVLFLASAITAGAALLLVVRYLAGRFTPLEGDDAAVGTLRRIAMVGLGAYFFLEFAEFSIALWNPTSHAPAVELVLYGPYWWVFWVIHVAVGGVLAMGLLAMRSSRAAWMAAGFLIAITFISTRLNVLIPGQAVGELGGLQDAFHHSRLDYIYHATPMEYLVGLFLVAVGMAVFFVGNRMSNSFTHHSAREAT